ncbi:MAG: hypothetical protein ABI536_09175 [Gallionella sp.]
MPNQARHIFLERGFYMNNGIVEFVEPFANLRKRLPLVEKRSAAENNAHHKLDSAIEDALWAWRTKEIDGHALLKTPENVVLTVEEFDLAGWIHEYATMSGMSFTSAMEKMFDYLKRYPKTLEKYTSGSADFAESGSGGISFAVPRGWHVDGQGMALFRRARIYQAGHPSCDFGSAVTAVA